MIRLRWVVPLVATFSLPASAFADGLGYRPRYDVSPKVRKQYADLAAAARLPVARADRIRPDGIKRTAVGELFKVEDGSVTIRVSLSEAQRAILVRQGVVTVREEAAIQSRVIFGRHLYQRYVAAPEVSLDHLADREGAIVRLELGQTEAGHLRIVSAALKR